VETGGWLLPLGWGVLGLTIVVCGLRASRSPRSLTVGLWAASVLWVLLGAGVHVWLLAGGTTYAGFADGSPIPYVRDTWQSLVVPHHHVFIALLIAGEALAGLGVLVAGRVREVALLALVAFNLTLVVFGWGFAIWGVPVASGLLLLYRADRIRNRRRQPSAGASSARHRPPRSRVPSP
jgi:hypothetical protein